MSLYFFTEGCFIKFPLIIGLDSIPFFSILFIKVFLFFLSLIKIGSPNHEGFICMLEFMKVKLLFIKSFFLKH